MRSANVRCALALLAAALPAAAHQPITTKLTWTQEISRIFFKRCAGCHREGGAAPMALTNYDQVRPWAVAIKEEVLERRMPPWGAVKGFGEFRDDPSLSIAELNWIVSWVEGGAPNGDEIYLPPLPPRVETVPPGKRVKRLQLPATLGAGVRAVSIQPRGLPDVASMEVIAHRRGGFAEHLIWIRDYRAQWNRRYYFREPVGLPKGTRIEIHGAVRGASAALGVAP